METKEDYEKHLKNRQTVQKVKANTSKDNKQCNRAAAPFMNRTKLTKPSATSSKTKKKEKGKVVEPHVLLDPGQAVEPAAKARKNVGKLRHHG